MIHFSNVEIYELCKQLIILRSIIGNRSNSYCRKLFETQDGYTELRIRVNSIDINLEYCAFKRVNEKIMNTYNHKEKLSLYRDEIIIEHLITLTSFLCNINNTITDQEFKLWIDELIIEGV